MDCKLHDCHLGAIVSTWLNIYVGIRVVDCKQSHIKARTVNIIVLGGNSSNIAQLSHLDESAGIFVRDIAGL